MATVLDITSKLALEEKILKIGDQEFRVDDSKNTVLQAMAAVERTEGSDTGGFTAMDKALELLIGEDAVKALDAMHLNLEGYKNVFIAVMSLASGISFEEAEQRFQSEE